MAEAATPSRRGTELKNFISLLPAKRIEWRFT
jgi:hypothetical protein